ncbi:MAG: hypothetical protein E7329_05920 [Clostridiales bacterium]|nr:hypothetical protein [Clostridiales bacterium]
MMNCTWKRAQIDQVRITDRFWTPYLENIRSKMIPYVFQKFEEHGFIHNFISVAEKDGKEHIGYPFSDGLVYEAMRGVFDFLRVSYDEALDQLMDRLVDIIEKAQDEDGYICTRVMQNYPDRRWGRNGAHITSEHDLYNHGALIEAAISQYLATGKTKLLTCAVKAANLICNTMGYPPKLNVIPGHSLEEEAFIKLYRLFRDHEELTEFAAAHHVDLNGYLEIVQYWYDNRGNFEGRPLPHPRHNKEYNQDHAPFTQQKEAVGHAVRAMLCYTGAAALVYETGDQNYFNTLNCLWDDVVHRKMHVTGGVGTRHDIEGFDEAYNLPNDAYLETCAAIGLAFWNGEMSLLDMDAKYFDCFERSLYNNILSSVGEDFTHYFYQNPLISDGDVRRWDWHKVPCCLPMLLKFHSSLASYIYSCSDDAACIHLFIDSEFKDKNFTISQYGKVIRVDSREQEMELRIRIPDYAENFSILMNGKPIAAEIEKGYAIFHGVWTMEQPLSVVFSSALRRVYAHPEVDAEQGCVCVQNGPYVLCAEGIDNGGKVDFTLPKQPDFKLQSDQSVIGKDAADNEIRLIPYYLWCNRNAVNKEEAKMAVWFKQEKMPDEPILLQAIGDKLYGNYEKLI